MTASLTFEWWKVVGGGLGLAWVGILLWMLWINSKPKRKGKR